MPIAPTYPGVYIQEIASGVHPIAGVATSIAAFVDYFGQGPINQPVHIFSLADFDRQFGGLDLESEASYAIQQFFLHGGGEAWVVRVASSAVGRALGKASVQIAPAIPAGGTPALTVEAISEGNWGNSLGVRVDPATAAGEFNLAITQYDRSGSRPVVVKQENFLNLSMDSSKTNFVEKVVNDANTGSSMVHVTANAGGAPPLFSGTQSGKLTDKISLPNPAILSVQPGTATAVNASLAITGDQMLPAIATALQNALRSAAPSNPIFAGATVSAAGNRLRILPGGTDPATTLAFNTVVGDQTAANLMLVDAGPRTVQVTLSDVHATEPAVPATFKIKATVKSAAGGSKNKTLTINLPAPPAGQVLADTAAALQTAVQGIDNADPVVSGTTLFTAGNRLIAMPGGADSTAVVTFDDGSASDTTATGILKLTTAGGAVTRSATLSGALAGDPNIPAGATVAATFDTTTVQAPLTFSGETLPKNEPLAKVGPALQTALANAAPANPAFQNVLVVPLTNELLVIPGGATTDKTFTFANAGASLAAQVLLLTGVGVTSNVAEYSLGAGSVANTAQMGGDSGGDGVPPAGNDLRGSPAPTDHPTGIYALEGADLFNLLCLPRAFQTGDGGLTDAERLDVITAAQAYCEQRRAFFLMDTPSGMTDPDKVRQWADAIPKSANAAFYYPRVQVPDPLNGSRLRSIGASGTVAGLYARTDANRGVWKAPAGTEATMRIAQLDDVLTDAENGMLNQLGINCLRTFPIYGSVAWGARTSVGADQQASEWKYVPVRRMALYLEESLYRGLKWVVFEPNDEPLWSQIRLNVGSFMQNLFRQGAFQGTTPAQAYLVKCDSETTTPADVNLGIVNILVGFAPLRPAEFVIIQLQQLAGQSAA